MRTINLQAEGGVHIAKRVSGNGLLPLCGEGRPRQATHAAATCQACLGRVRVHRLEWSAARQESGRTVLVETWRATDEEERVYTITVRSDPASGGVYETVLEVMWGNGAPALKELHTSWAQASYAAAEWRAAQAP